MMKRKNLKDTEKTIVEIYYSSKKKDIDNETEKAIDTVNCIIDCFRLISIFTNNNHTAIVKQLYFSKENVCVIGPKRIAQKVFVHENTLHTYREKYCLIISLVLVRMERDRK